LIAILSGINIGFVNTIYCCQFMFHVLKRFSYTGLFSHESMIDLMTLIYLREWMILHDCVFMFIFYKLRLKVTFEVRLEVNSCPKDQEQWSNTIQIHPVGIEEKLTATVFLDCDCPCEMPKNTVSNEKPLLICTFTST